MKSWSVTIQMKATDQYFPVVLFLMLYNVVLTFDELLSCDKSNESYWASLTCRTRLYISWWTFASDSHSDPPNVLQVSSSDRQTAYWDRRVERTCVVLERRRVAGLLWERHYLINRCVEFAKIVQNWPVNFSWKPFFREIGWCVTTYKTRLRKVQRFQLKN